MLSSILLGRLGGLESSDVIGLTIRILILLLYLGCWAAIFQKAGYSRWCFLTAFIPPIPLIWLACATWPLERRYLCSLPSESIGERDVISDEERARALLFEAWRLVRKQQYERALPIYADVTKRFAGTAVGNDARIEIESLQAKMRAEAAG